MIGLIACETCAVYSGLLSGADTDGLAVLRIRYGVRLCVLDGDEGDGHVETRLLGELLVLAQDVCEGLIGHLVLVATLLEGHTEYLLVLDRIRAVARVDLDDVIVALLLRLQDLECLLRIVRGNDAIGHFAVDDAGGRRITGIRQRDEVAIRRHTIDATCSRIRAGKRRLVETLDVVYEAGLLQLIGKLPADCGTGRGNVLERSGGDHTGGFLEIGNELPAVQCIEEVDIARTAIQNLDRKVRAVVHVDLRRLLIRVHTIL